MRGSSVHMLSHDGDTHIVQLPGCQFVGNNNLQVSNPIGAPIRLMKEQEEVASWSGNINESIHLESSYHLEVDMPEDEDTPPPTSMFRVSISGCD